MWVDRGQLRRWFSTCGSWPPRCQTTFTPGSPIRCSAYQTFALLFRTATRLQLWVAMKWSYGWDHHGMRNCIKGSQLLGRLRTTDLSQEGQFRYQSQLHCKMLLTQPKRQVLSRYTPSVCPYVNVSKNCFAFPLRKLWVPFLSPPGEAGTFCFGDHCLMHS